MSNKVLYAKCDNYDQKNIDTALDFLLNNLDNFEERISKAKKILIKPNLLTARSPEQAVTTHPEILIALINKIKNPNTEIILADSSAGPYNKNCIEKIYSTCKMDLVSEATGCQLNRDFSDVDVKFPNGQISKNYKIIRIAEEADLIINFAKLKTHCFTLLTGATKNLFGLIPGVLKVQYHLTMPDIDIFCGMLLDIEEHYANKTISFIDGILGMEGFGPSNGTPINSRCILASENPVELDILACKIMGINPEKVMTIMQAYKRNIISSTSIDDLNIISSDEIEKFNFKLPSDRTTVLPKIVPDWLVKGFNNLMISKPIIKQDYCTGCKVCELSCPPHVIKVNNKVATIQDYNKCIKCYCCQELCPNNAIELKKPFLRKLLGVLLSKHNP